MKSALLLMGCVLNKEVPRYIVWAAWSSFHLEGSAAQCQRKPKLPPKYTVLKFSSFLQAAGVGQCGNACFMSVANSGSPRGIDKTYVPLWKKRVLSVSRT